MKWDPQIRSIDDVPHVPHEVPPWDLEHLPWCDAPHDAPHDAPPTRPDAFGDRGTHREGP